MYVLASFWPMYEFCLPTRATAVPGGPDWLHEIKYDGFRLRVERNGDRVRLIIRNGYDWTKRYPWIVESALKYRQKQFIIDGEAVVPGVDGVSDFDALYSGRHLRDEAGGRGGLVAAMTERPPRSPSLRCETWASAAS